MSKVTTSLEIRPITKVFDDKQAHEFLLVCPHCDAIRGIEKEGRLRELAGEQYQDNLCGGWYEISPTASLVGSVEALENAE